MYVELLNGHKKLVGHTEDGPYEVTADENGFAEVEGVVGEQLIALGSANEVKSPDSDKSFSDMTVKELRAFASEHKVALGSARTRDEIIAVLDAAEGVQDSNDGKGPEGAPNEGVTE